MIPFLLLMYVISFINRYCSSRDNLTIDHVLPISRGGEWKWENLVCMIVWCDDLGLIFIVVLCYPYIFFCTWPHVPILIKWDAFLYFLCKVTQNDSRKTFSTWQLWYFTKPKMPIDNARLKWTSVLNCMCSMMYNLYIAF